jgi:hypothetical protein
MPSKKSGTRRATAANLVQGEGLAQVLRKAKRAVRRYSGIVGVDFGYAYEDETPTGETAIRYHVARKKPLRNLPPEERLPKRIGGKRVDVIESGFKPHGPSPFDEASTLQPGLSIGNIPRDADGTLGCILRDARDGSLCILSNWHVLCGNVVAGAGDMIAQPGPIVLGGNTPRQVAALKRWLSPTSGIDAAIATLADSFPFLDTLLGSQTSITGIAAPTLGMTVVKSGMASGLTHAQVDGVGGSYLVPYDAYPEIKCWMQGIHLVLSPSSGDQHVSQPGDSGSIWIDTASGAAVALHFAGEDDGGPLNEYALAHALPEVVSRLELSWIAGGGSL